MVVTTLRTVLIVWSSTNPVIKQLSDNVGDASDSVTMDVPGCCSSRVVTTILLTMAADPPGPLTLGEMIRRQRELAAVPLRQVAAAVGISSAYLSQIERNLREPSERVLDAIADQLQMSPDVLVAEANRARSDTGLSEVVLAIRRDKDLTNAQRQTLEEMYETFRDVTIQRRRRNLG